MPGGDFLCFVFMIVFKVSLIIALTKIDVDIYTLRMLVWQADIYYCAQTCICNNVVSAQPRYQGLSSSRLSFGNEAGISHAAVLEHRTSSNPSRTSVVFFKFSLLSIRHNSAK